MRNLDEEIKELENKIATSIAIHIMHLKSKGQCGFSILETIRDWETEELSDDETEQSTMTTMLIEASILEIIAKSLKQEVERMINEEEKN